VTPSKNTSLALEILACLAAGVTTPQPFMFMTTMDSALLQRILDRVPDPGALSASARVHPNEFVLAFAADDDAASAVTHALHALSFPCLPAVKSLFLALCSRWLAISLASLSEYERLLAEHVADESVF
jgi:hypothetical protein